jgi:hypothetical protein
MARSYKRDKNGRFSGGGGGGGKKGGGGKAPKTTSARGRARSRETAARAAVKAGGGTRAARSLATAQRARDFYKATGTGTRRSATRPRSGIRPTGKLPRPQAANGIKRTPALGRKGNTIKPYKPATPSGQMQQMGRRVSRAGRAMSDAMGSVRKVRASADAMKQRFARRTARDIANSTGTGITADVARMSVRVAPPQEVRAARGIIARRAQRAAAAAARGSKPAAKAAAIYDRQLAPVLPKGKGKGKNNLRPGPGNTKGAPKKKRKPRKKG